MALSGYFNTDYYQDRCYFFQWSAEQSIVSNTSTIKWELWAYGVGPYPESMVLCIIDGEEKCNITNWGDRYYGLVAEGTYIVEHDETGRGNFTVRLDAQVGNLAYLKNVTTVQLDQIPRASLVNATSGYIEDIVTISISRKSTKFQHTLRYEFGGLLGVVAADIGTSYEWQLPTILYAQMPDSTSGDVTVYCDTYMGDVLIGTTKCTLTVMTSAEKCLPILNPTLYDENDLTVTLTGNNTYFIKGKSNVQFDTGATAVNYATVKSQRVTNGAKSSFEKEGVLEGVESNKFQFTVTDSRGYVNIQTIHISLIEYVNLSTHITAQQQSASGDVDILIEGKYFNDTFGLAKNELSLWYRYKKVGGEYGEWIEVKPEYASRSYSAVASLSGLDSSGYILQSRAVDKLMDVIGEEIIIKAKPTFDWSGNDFSFNVPVAFNEGFSGEGIDDEFSTESVNPIKNKVVSKKMNEEDSKLSLIKATLGYEKKNFLACNNLVEIEESGIVWTPVYDEVESSKMLYVSATGTAENDSYFTLFEGATIEPEEGVIGVISYVNIDIPNGKYKMSCGVEGAKTTYGMVATNRDALKGVIGEFYNYTGDTEIPVAVIDQLRLYVKAGTTVNNLKFYPMIRPADIEDNSYASYVPSVFEMLPRKLWENPKPTSNFNAQTVNLSSDNYDCLKIIYKAGTTSTTRYESSVGEKGEVVSAIIPTGGSSNGGGRRYRNATISEDGNTVTFTACTNQAFGAAGATANQYFIPLRIIGYKYFKS